MKNYLIYISLLFSSTLFALEQPTGRVILTVTGKITNINHTDSAIFDQKMLTKLPQKTITTRTPWSEGKHTYTGFSPIDFFELIGIQGDDLSITALNDYTVEVPVGDFTYVGAIFATHMDGVPMTIRNKGPIMVIYPFDDQSNLKIETYFSRSIWQVTTISVK